MTRHTQQYRGDLAVGPSLTSLSPDPVILYPGDGAYVPVAVTGGAITDLGPPEQLRGQGYHVVAMPSKGAACEVAPGTWNSRQRLGEVLVMNTSELDVEVKLGDVVGGLFGGSTNTATTGGGMLQISSHFSHFRNNNL